MKSLANYDETNPKAAALLGGTHRNDPNQEPPPRDNWSFF